MQSGKPVAPSDIRIELASPPPQPAKGNSFGAAAEARENLRRRSSSRAADKKASQVAERSRRIRTGAIAVTTTTILGSGAGGLEGQYGGNQGGPTAMGPGQTAGWGALFGLAAGACCLLSAFVCLKWCSGPAPTPAADRGDQPARGRPATTARKIQDDRLSAQHLGKLHAMANRQAAAGPQVHVEIRGPHADAKHHASVSSSPENVSAASSSAKKSMSKSNG